MAWSDTVWRGAWVENTTNTGMVERCVWCEMLLMGVIII